MDGNPTPEHPYPTVNLGYDSTSKMKNIVPTQARKRRRLFNVDTGGKDTEYETVDSGYRPHELATVETSVEQIIELPEVSDEIDVIPDEILHDVANNVEVTIMEPLLLEFSFIVLFLHFISVYVNLVRTVLILTAQVKRLKWEKSQCFQKVRKL